MRSQLLIGANGNIYSIYLFIIYSIYLLCYVNPVFIYILGFVLYHCDITSIMAYEPIAEWSLMPFLCPYAPIFLLLDLFIPNKRDSGGRYNNCKYCGVMRGMIGTWIYCLLAYFIHLSSCTI